MKKCCETHDTCVILSLSKIYDYLKQFICPFQGKHYPTSSNKNIPFTVILASVKMKGEQVQTLKTYLAHNIELTDIQAQYDENAKALIADKQVLARIAKYRTTEFKDYDIPTIINCIEGEPEISKIPVFPGMRNTASESITGMNNESTIPNEGTVTFDVRFYMVTPDHIRIKLILNIELQKEYYESYHFEPRAVFYCARMISEQLGREFTTTNYDNLKKVYSIWIFFDAPQKECDTITEYYLEKKDAYGKPVKAWKHDYISISFIRLSTTKEKNSKHQLIHMLDTLFSNELNVENKKRILVEKHQMKMTRELEGGIDTMCNVSQGIADKAFAQGEQNMLLELLRDGIITVADAAKKLCLSEDKVKEMLNN